MDDEEQIQESAWGNGSDLWVSVFRPFPMVNKLSICFVKHKTAGNPFSAVILDLTIPGGLGGKEVVKEMLSLDPHLRAIVVSGYSNDPVLANYTRIMGLKAGWQSPSILVDLSIVLGFCFMEMKFPGIGALLFLVILMHFVFFQYISLPIHLQ